MKIAFDHQIFCGQPYGGISRYFASIAESMLAMGHDMRVFAPFYINRYLEELSPYVVQGRKLGRYPPRTLHIFELMNRSIATRQISKWRPDIVHETYFSNRTSGPAGVPVVVTVYDMIHEVRPDMLVPGDRISELKRIAVERADHVICISNFTRNDLIRLFKLPEEKVSTIHLATSAFAGAKLPIPIIRSEHARPYLLFVGVRGRYKNFAGLLGAVARSKNLKTDFDIVAFGGGKFLHAEQEMINGQGFKPGQVRHAGDDDSALAKLYGKAAAFIFPSLYEGFGLPPLEAMAHDCPVVSSNTSSMPEVIGDAGQFFPPEDIGAMAQAIESVVYSDSRRKELIGKGRRRLEQFSWRKCADETMAVYKSLRDD